MTNGASTNYMQATIEIFGAVVTFVFLLMFLFITERRKRSEKNITVVMVLSVLALILDAGWYVFDGNTSSYGFLLNKLCNVLIFLCNPLITAFSNGYACNIIRESGAKPRPTLMYIIFFICTLALAIPIVNIFHPVMYTINEKNVYHRLSGWYLFTGLICIAIVLVLAFVIIHRKSISRRRMITLCMFCFIPFIGIGLQSFMMGISFIQISVAIGSVAILTGYLMDWIEYDQEGSGVSAEKKNFWIVESFIAILILCIGASLAACTVAVTNVASQNSEQYSQSITLMASETIDAVLSEPINVSKTMAQAPVIIDALSQEKLEGSSNEQEMLKFMKRIKNEYDYQMIFVASEKTKAYYTYDGLSRYMRVDDDLDDAWYNEYKRKGIEYELNVDTDKDNLMSLAVFVNMGVRSADGELLGVCGVAMSMESLMDLLEEYQTQFDCHISLVDSSGLIQVDTDRDKIEQESFGIDVLVGTQKNGIHYVRSASEAMLTRYMDRLGWYLIVKDMQPNRINVFSIILPCIMICGIGIILLLVYIVLFNVHDNKRMREISRSMRLSETDGLTGLKNRYSMEKTLEEMERESIPRDFTVAMIDLNGLKVINDTIGHAAGDELIMGAAAILTKAFGKKGNIFRIGGDEFLVMMNCTSEELEEMKARLKKEMSDFSGTMVKHLSMAYGTAAIKDYPDITVDALIAEADRIMYDEKRRYYEQTKNDRRSR